MARTSAEIQADLTLLYAARTAAATGQSYTLDTGQGRQSVTRANLTEINRAIQQLEADLEEITLGPSPGLNFQRGFE
jgi:hypothetical protein